jgi:hypothetical protein
MAPGASLYGAGQGRGPGLTPGPHRVRSGQTQSSGAVQGSKTLSSPVTCKFTAGPGLSCGQFVLVEQPAENLVTLYPRRRQVSDQGVAALGRPRVHDPGAGDAGCRARGTRLGPPAGAAARRPASGRWPRSGRCAPGAQHGRSLSGCAAGSSPPRSRHRTAPHRTPRCTARPDPRITNRNRVARSARSISRFRACCTASTPPGCAVTPQTWTWRVPASITNNTQARRKGHRAAGREQTACQHRERRRAQELPPRRAAALRRGRDPQPFQDPPHRRGPARYPGPGNSPRIR